MLQIKTSIYPDCPTAWQYGQHKEEGTILGALYDNDELIIGGEWNTDNLIIIDQNGDEWDLEQSIPVRWLFEDFEKEYDNGVKLYKQKQIEKTEKLKLMQQKRQEEKKKIIAAAAIKLTARERKALGI